MGSTRPDSARDHQGARGAGAIPGPPLAPPRWGKPGLIAGFCLCSLYDEENKRVGRREGWIGELGTIRGWRRKGLGRALLLHGLHSLKSEGLDTALLGVDSESLTGAQHLYESVGFRIRDRELQYERPLDEVDV